MKHIIEHYANRDIIFKSLKSIEPRELGSRKNIEIYLGVNVKNYYIVVMRVSKKSRVLTREVLEIANLHIALEKYIDSKIKKKYIWIKSPLCSKAKKNLEEDGWKVDLHD